MIPEKLTSSRHDIDNKLFAMLLTTICHSKTLPHQSSQRQIKKFNAHKKTTTAQKSSLVNHHRGKSGIPKHLAQQSLLDIYELFEIGNIMLPC